MRRTILPTLAIAIAIAVATAACGGGEPAAEDTAPGGDAGAPTAMCAPDTPDCVDVVMEGDEPAADDAIIAPDVPVVDVLQQEPKPVTATPGATSESSPVFLQEATIDGTTLRVSFSGGHAPCFVIESAEAVERDDEVILNVRAGAEKGTDQASCTTVVEMQYVEIELSGELGTRALLDGSRVFQGDVQY